MYRLRRLLPVILLSVLPPAPALAGTPAEADPSVYLQAFDDTCRHGFPDLDLIAQHAAAQGWVERSMRPVDGAADIFSAKLPRALGKDGLMLFLTVPASGAFKAVCQITGTARTSLSGRDVAAVLTPGLKAGEPTLGSGNPKEDDYAVWTVAPGTTVQAGVSVYRRKVRSLSISLRQAP